MWAILLSLLSPKQLITFNSCTTRKRVCQGAADIQLMFFHWYQQEKCEDLPKIRGHGKHFAHFQIFVLEKLRRVSKSWIYLRNLLLKLRNAYQSWANHHEKQSVKNENFMQNLSRKSGSVESNKKYVNWA